MGQEERRREKEEEQDKREDGREDGRGEQKHVTATCEPPRPGPVTGQGRAATRNRKPNPGTIPNCGDPILNLRGDLGPGPL